MTWTKTGNIRGPVTIPLPVAQGGTGAVNAATARTNLGLGTAAAQNSTAFATAAQGALASSALQNGANATFGNVTVTGAQTTGYVLQESGTPSHVWQFIALSGVAGIWNNALGYVVTFNYTTGAANFLQNITCVHLTQTSDARLKKNVRRDKNRYRGIRKVVEMVLYDRTSGSGDNEAGVLAQELQKAGCHADDFVKSGADGVLGIAYAQLALACALDPEPQA